MKLTMKGDYGLRAMLDMAAYYGQGPVESSDIASRQYIPEQYLDQILMVLRKEGLVKSIRVAWFHKIESFMSVRTTLKDVVPCNAGDDSYFLGVSQSL